MALNVVTSDASQADGTALFSRPTISGVHTFTYDAADNLITKTTPCTDDFDDGNFNGWFVWDGSWAVTNKVLQQTGASGGSLMMDNWSDANNEIRFSYRNTNTAANEKSAAIFRFNNGTFNRSHLSLYPSNALIEENIGGTFYTRASTAISTVQGQWYDVRIVADGGSVKVWRGPRGGNMDLIFNATGVLSVTTSANFGVYAGGTSYQLDDFQGIGGGVANTTTTYAYDSGNRQTSMTSMGVTTSNGYDDWGRLTTSTTSPGGVTARYAWRYGSKLYSVDQDNNGTAEVTYKTGGDGKRRARITAASETWYNWDAGFTVISEESGSSGTGALTRTYVGRSLAHVDGSNPATGTWRYMYHDHLGSVRQVRDANRNLVAEYAFLPYGQTDAWSGTANATTRLFTGHDRDPLTGQDYAPYRWYSNTMNRWLSRDPLGMVDGPNVYAYVRGNPVLRYDMDGLISTWGRIKCRLIGEGISMGIGAGGSIIAPGVGTIVGGAIGGALGSFVTCICERDWDMSKAGCCVGSSIFGLVFGAIGGILGIGAINIEDMIEAIIGGMVGGLVGNVAGGVADYIGNDKNPDCC